MDSYNPFASIGWLLMLLGLILVALPYLTRMVPALDKVPWWIIWVYKRDGFYFATSPLLILLSLLSIVLNILRK